MPTEDPPGAGAVTYTTYLNGGKFSGAGGLEAMNVTIKVTASLWDAPAKWQVDSEGHLSGGMPANYGYQVPDEAEFSFGNPAGRAIFHFEIQFGQPVNNPSFFLLDVDNNGSDHGTLFEGTILGGGTVYPSLSLMPGTSVAWTGWGPTLDVFSNGGPSTDSQAAGAAFFEWHQANVTSLSFSWESSTNTSIRLSNIYAEFDPAGFGYAVPEAPSAMLIFLAGLGLWHRRR